MSTTAADRPWLRFYGDVPASLSYPEITLYEALAASAGRTPESIAYDFLGVTATYAELLASVDRCANALAALGLGPGERMTISMPTSPQGVIPFYAAAKLGAVASMIHPLSAPGEIAGYLNRSGSRIAVTLDAFYGSFAAIEEPTPLETLILARISDDLPLHKRLGFWATRGRKIPKVPPDPRVRWWSSSWPRSIPPFRPPRQACTSRRRSSTRAERRGHPKASCSRTRTSSARGCRCGRGSVWARATQFSPRCRSSMGSASRRSSTRGS